MSLLVEGKLLNNPNAQLSESNLTSHSMVTCECIPALLGGMQKPSPKVLVQPTNESYRQKRTNENEDEKTSDEDVRSQVQSDAESEENKQTLDMEEFDALKESIVTAEADAAEVRRFEELASLYAQKEVEGYQFDDEEQKELIDKNYCGEQYKEEIHFA